MVFSSGWTNLCNIVGEVKKIQTLFTRDWFYGPYFYQETLQGGFIRDTDTGCLDKIFYSTGASDRSSYPIFNKRFDHLETLLTIHRPKKVLSAGSLCGPLVPSPQSKCPKRTFMLPQKYHVSVSNMLSKPLKCFMENEN